MTIFRTAGAIAALAALLPASANAATIAKSDLFVPSVLRVDTITHTGTFVLHRGRARGETVWYILTDASNAGVAKARGLAYAPDLARLGAGAIAQARRSGNVVQFSGAPDFSPERSYVASKDGFPPASAHPGAVADAAYSPFVHVAGTPGVLNAPIVASGNGPFDVRHHTDTQDRVVAIDAVKRTVTLVLARGFVGGKPVYYVSTEASDPVAAAVERATYVPRLTKAGAAAAIPIGVVVKGPLAGSAPQGLAYLALRTPLSSDATLANAATIGSPFNVLALVPDVRDRYAANAYSPLWSAQAVTKPQKTRLTSYAQIAGIAKPAGFVVNCPAISLGAANGY
jgi:hypothetical protein